MIENKQQEKTGASSTIREENLQRKYCWYMIKGAFKAFQI